MFHVRIAGVVVGIDNHYEYIHELCENYIVTGETPAFIVRAEEREIDQEAAVSPALRLSEGRGYYESNCLYRKICLGMVDYDGFLMHSAVIEVGGHALAFAAKSGTGKSTHICLWRKHFGREIHIINGDKPIYRFIDGQLYACGTPWRGKEFWGRNAMAPLKSLCFLEQGAENHLERLSPAEIMPRLFHQLLLPEREELLSIEMDMADSLIREVPFYLLTCNMSEEAAVTAYQELSRA